MARRHRWNGWMQWLTNVGSTSRTGEAGNRCRRVFLEQLESRVVLDGNPPTINFESFNTDEGSGIAMRLTVSSDPPTELVTVEWYLNGAETAEFTDENVPGDGSFVVEHILTWAELEGLGINDGGSPTQFFTDYPVALLATDETGDAALAETAVTVLNISPEITSFIATPSGGGGGGGCGGGGGDVTISAVILEPGPAAELAQLTAEVDWGDGSTLPVELVLVAPGQYGIDPADATHSYTEGGDHVIVLTVTEADLIQDGASFDVAEATASLGGGGGGEQTVCLGEDGVLTVNGSAGSDTVTVTTSGGNVQVNSNFPDPADSFPTGLVSQIIVLLGDGNDIIINTTSKSMVAVGGAGNDILTDGGGRGILIGGDGTDVLFGGGGQDILIDSSTIYDGVDAALLGLLTYWNTGTNATVGTRINNLRAGIAVVPENSGGFSELKLDSTTILGDGDFDLLLGGSGSDWILLHSEDFSLGFGDTLDLLTTP